MSWSMEYAGKRDDVVYVKGHGHADGNGSNGSPRNSTLEVRQMYEPPPRAA